MSAASASEDREFLTFCQLVQEALIASPSDSNIEREPVDPGLCARARTFALDPARGADNTGDTFRPELKPSELVARLFDSPELIGWHYRQLRVMHANVVLDEHSSTGRAFEIFSDRPYLAPRLVPSLAYVARSENATLKFPEWFPRAVEAIEPPLLDPHFSHGYAYLLSAFDEMAGDLGHVPELRNAYRMHWDGGGRRSLLMQVLGLETINAGRNVFGRTPPQVALSASHTQAVGVSERRRVFFDLVLGVDRMMNAIGDWWKETSWTLEKSYVRAEADRSPIERGLGITFLEEGEILWELLHFYTCALSTEERRSQMVPRLLELLWIAQRKGETWMLSERFENLRSWAVRAGEADFSSADQLAEVVAANVRGRDPQVLLGKCRSIVPVYAFLMTLPPPTGVYRCEVGFKLLSDLDPTATIRNVWWFSTINVPEQLRNQDDAFSLMESLIAKQKLLVNVIVNARLREVFKEANQRTILLHGKKSTIAAIMARNMSHNIGSHVLSRVATARGLIASLAQPEEMATGGDVRKFAHAVSPVATLNAYLRTRMDFLADIATGEASGNVSLAIRKDIIELFSNQSILRQHISGTKDLQVGNIELDLTSWRPSDADDVVVAIPNGVLGSHAFYVIVENMLRNCAKHVPHLDRTQPIELRLVVRPAAHRGLIEVCIYDKLKSVGPRTLESLNGSTTIMGRLAEKISDHHGMAVPGAWGLKEMRICAAYLRGLRSDKVDSSEYQIKHGGSQVSAEPPLLEAIKHSDGSLGYRFYLQKPGHVLIVDAATRPAVDADVRARLGAEGIIYRTEDEAAGLGWPHDFVVLLGPKLRRSSKLYCDGAQARLRSTRVIHVDEPDEISIPAALIERLFISPTSFAEEFVTCLWRHWVSMRVCAPSVPALVIQTDGANDIWGDMPDLVATPPENDTSRLAAGSIVYNRHAGRYCEHILIGPDQEGTFTDGALSYDAYGGHSPVASLIEPASSRREGRIRLAYQLIESGASGVIILDERAQGDCPSLVEIFSGRDVRLSELLRASRVFIPATRDSSLNGLDLDSPNLEDVGAWLRKYMTGDMFDRIAFLVVHLTVLEKLFRDDTECFDEYAAAEQIDHWERSGTTVVITSGKGNDGAVRQIGARFVHWSQISRHVLESRSKHHLCGALYGARRLRT